MYRARPRSTLFPYTTLFRSVTIDGEDRCKVAIQTNNVETDERGYIYIVDRANTGLHILELTGAARDRKSTRLNSSHPSISYAVFCLKKKKTQHSQWIIITIP